jgi:hypothetical protein
MAASSTTQSSSIGESGDRHLHDYSRLLDLERLT